MQYSMKNKRDMDKLVSFNKQAGISTLLFIVLVGLSLTVLTVGYMSSMRNLQSSATTAHAQTQAQMQSMIGYQALGEFLKAQSLANIAKIETGTVSGGATPIQFKKIACGTNQYCFDITGKSGGASAILRTNFNIVDEIEAKAQTGSVFAGGLKVGNAATFEGVGNNVSIAVGAASSTTLAGQVLSMNGDVIALSNITVNAYTGGLNAASALSIRRDANYIITRSNGVNVCYKNNLGTTVIETVLTTCPAGVNYNTSGNLIGWEFKPHEANIVGVVWFDNNVKVLVADSSTDESNIVKNAIISTGEIEIAKVTSNTRGALNLFSPFDYVFLSDKSTADRTADLIKTRLDIICPQANYPAQYCLPYNATERAAITDYSYFSNNYTKFLKNVDVFPASLSNILLLTDGGFSISADNQAVTNLYGNLIGTSGAGGTGRASAKFIGTGNVNVTGNMVVTGETELSEISGSVVIKLGNTKSGGNYIPIYKKVMTVGGIRYM